MIVMMTVMRISHQKEREEKMKIQIDSKETNLVRII